MSLDSLQQRIGYQFKQPALLSQALTHRSFASINNERLEYLGDGALNFVIAHLLFNRFEKLPEGDLSRLRAQLVKEGSLFEIAQALQIGDLLKLGEGELKSAGWRRPSILSDALEAIIGAAYLDGGFEAAYEVVQRLYADKLNMIDPKSIDKDAKSQLQEYLQSKKAGLPDYNIITIDGEAHAQSFKVICEIKGLNIATTGEGTSRRNAEQQAAQLAMEALKLKKMTR